MRHLCENVLFINSPASLAIKEELWLKKKKSQQNHHKLSRHFFDTPLKKKFKTGPLFSQILEDVFSRLAAVSSRHCHAVIYFEIYTILHLGKPESC